MDTAAVIYIAVWYLGNYFYNSARRPAHALSCTHTHILALYSLPLLSPLAANCVPMILHPSPHGGTVYNKNAGKASGGAEFAFTLATIQLVVGSLYAIFLWVAPEARTPPKMTFKQVMALAPLGLWAAMAHAGAVYAMTAGAVSFGQIVKAGEPVFAVVVGYLAYSKTVSLNKILCLIPIIGGIAIASAKELDFTWGSLIAASTANVASAFRGAENKRIMDDAALKKAVGGTGNAYAITTLWATVILAPMIFISGEYAKLTEFKAIWAADGVKGSIMNLQFNTIMSGLTFYGYNEVSTMALKSLSGVSHSVANTAKRAVVIVGSAIAFGEDMGFEKSTGCAIAIGGTFLYAIADDIPKMLGMGDKSTKA
jgi:solute carrier family 35 protein E1